MGQVSSFMSDSPVIMDAFFGRFGPLHWRKKSVTSIRNVLHLCGALIDQPFCRQPSKAHFYNFMTNMCYCVKSAQLPFSPSSFNVCYNSLEWTHDIQFFFTILINTLLFWSHGTFLFSIYINLWNKYHMETGQFLVELINVWSWIIFSQPHLQRLDLAQLHY